MQCDIVIQMSDMDDELIISEHQAAAAAIDTCLINLKPREKRRNTMDFSCNKHKTKIK